MALVVEDGTGLNNADSYVSLTFVRTYWLNVGVTITSDDTVLEPACRQATRYMELRFRNRWDGCILAEDQSLSWPRLYVYDHEGRLLEDQVPLLVQQACAEYVKRALDSTAVGQGLAPDPSLEPNIVSERVGPISTTYIPGSVPRFSPIPAADDLLVDLLRSGGAYAIR